MTLDLSRSISMTRNQFPKYLRENVFCDEITRKIKNIPLVNLSAFEIYLGNSSRVDFNIAISTHFGEQQFFIREESGNNSTIPANLRKFLAHLCNPDFQLKLLIETVWLVLDNPTSECKNEPFGYYVSFPQNGLTSNAGIKAELILRTLLFLDIQLSSIVYNSFFSFCLRLPQAVAIKSIGVRNGDRYSPIRVYLVSFQYKSLIELLISSKWLGDAGKITRFINNMPADILCFGLLIDWDNGIATKIGVEFWLKDNCSRNDLLNKLVSMGLCSTDQMNCIEEWDSKKIELDFNEKQEIEILTWVPYIKIIFDADNITAKAYLGQRFVLRKF